MDTILVAVAVTTAVRFCIFIRASKKKHVHRHATDKVTLQAVGHVSSLNLFPVKSVKGMSLEKAQCMPTGMATVDRKVYDRQWTVCVQREGYVLAQSRREMPKLAQISGIVHDEKLILSAPGMGEITVPVNTKLDRENNSNKTMVKVSTSNPDEKVAGAIDCGEKAAKWLERFLGRSGIRLVLISADVALRPLKMTTEQGYEDSYNVRAQDLAPFNIASQESLDDLNSHLESHVPMGQFRPNIEVSGCEPYAEDYWQKLYIGDATFQKVERCFRCLFVTASENTGKKHPEGEPFTTLKTYRPLTKYHGTMRPFFGVWFRLVKPGIVRVGDTVYLEKKSSD